MTIFGKSNFDKIKKLRIRVFLISSDVVVDTFVHSLVTGEIGQSIPIVREFKTDKQFDAIAFGYMYEVQG